MEQNASSVQTTLSSDKMEDVNKLTLFARPMMMLADVSPVSTDISWSMDHVSKLLKKWTHIAIFSTERSVSDALGDIDSIWREFASNLTIFVDFTIQLLTNARNVTQDSW